MSTDHNEAMRLADVCEDESRSNPDDYRWQAAALLRQQADRITELESHVHTCGPTCSKAGCINRRLTAERDQLRAEVERLRAVGSQLANVAFNWSQEANGTGQRLSAEDRSLLKSLQMQWDAARTQKDEG